MRIFKLFNSNGVILLVYEEIAHYPVTLDVFQLSQNKDVQLEVVLGLAGEKQSPSTESSVN